MMKLICTTLASAVMACGANAAQLQFTASGAVASNTVDTYGYFGPAGASLSGQSFTLSLTYDTTLGVRARRPGQVSVTGQAGTPQGQPITAAQLVLNGKTYVLGRSQSSGSVSLQNTGKAYLPYLFELYQENPSCQAITCGTVLFGGYLRLNSGVETYTLQRPFALNPPQFGQLQVMFTPSSYPSQPIESVAGEFTTATYSVVARSPNIR